MKVEHIHFSIHEMGSVVSNIVSGGTIAFSKFDDCVLFQVALCSVSDSFSKKFGRKLSEKRLALQPIRIDRSVFIEAANTELNLASFEKSVLSPKLTLSFRQLLDCASVFDIANALVQTVVFNHAEPVVCSIAAREFKSA